MKGCRPLTDAEVQAVLCQLDRGCHPARDKALFVLGLRTGFRISELLSIRLGDVFQDGKVPNQVQVARKHMKGKREGRIVVLHPDAQAALEVQAKELVAHGHTAPDTFLFRSRMGQNRALNRRSAWAMLKKAYRGAGLMGKLATHTMRKTFAKKVFEKSGGNIYKTQKALDHASPASTTAYLHVDQGEIDDLILKS